MHDLDQGPPPRLGVLLSGGGRTLQNLIDRINDGRLVARIVAVVGDRETAQGLTRAKQAGIPTLCSSDPDATFDFLRQHQVELACLGGYLRQKAA